MTTAPSISPLASPSHVPSLHAELIVGAAALQTLAPAWLSLFSRSPAATPFQHPAWLLPFLTITPHPAALAVFGETSLVALLPLQFTRSFPLRVAAPLGSAHPSYLGLLLDPAFPQAVDVLSSFTRSDRPFDLLLLHDLASIDEVTPKFLASLANAGAHVTTFPRNCCHTITLNCTYDAYLTRTKSAKRRHELRRESRKLHEGRTVNFQDLQGSAITPDIVSRLAPIQRASHLSQRGAEILDQPFHYQLLQSLAHADLARLTLVTVDGQDAAFGLSIVAAGQLHYVHTAFKSVYTPLSIGKALTAHLIEQACVAGLQSFDFGHGDAEYKQFWATDRRSVSRVAVALTPSARLVAAVCKRRWSLAKNPLLRSLVHRVRKSIHVGRKP